MHIHLRMCIFCMYLAALFLCARLCRGCFFSLFELLLQALNLLLLVLDGFEQFVEFLVLDGGRVLFVHALEEVGEDVHIVDKRIVGRLIVCSPLVDMVHVVQVVEILQQ